jgi:hypothetical protein
MGSRVLRVGDKKPKIPKRRSAFRDKSIAMELGKKQQFEILFKLEHLNLSLSAEPPSLHRNRTLFGSGYSGVDGTLGLLLDAKSEPCRS